MNNIDFGKIKGSLKQATSATTLGGSYILPPNVKPTKEQMKEVTIFKKGIKEKARIQKANDKKELKSWADKQYKKGKLSGTAWSEYVMKVV